MFIILYFWNYAGERGPQVLAARAACLSALSQIIFVCKNSVLRHSFFVKWTKRLMIFRETAAIYSQNHKRAVKTLSVKLQITVLLGYVVWFRRGVVTTLRAAVRGILATVRNISDYSTRLEPRLRMSSAILAHPQKTT
jgi:hypothetical protein